mgnify:CR=1 FL=1
MRMGVQVVVDFALGCQKTTLGGGDGPQRWG